MLELSPGPWAAPWGILDFPTWPSPRSTRRPTPGEDEAGKAMESPTRLGGRDLKEAGWDQVALRYDGAPDTSPEFRSRCCARGQ